MADDREFDARVARIESLTTTLERLPDPAARSASRELAALLLDLHGAALAKIMELAGESLVPVLARDPLVANLLLLHGLHPVDLETRVNAALDRVRSRLGSGMGVDLVSLDDGTLRLRISGGCGGCPSSTAATRKAVEDAVLGAAPDLEGVEFLDPFEGPRGHALLPVITL